MAGPTSVLARIPVIVIVKISGIPGFTAARAIGGSSGGGGATSLTPSPIGC